MNDLVTIFGNGFFPVVMCAVLFWYIIQKDSQHGEEIKALKEQMDTNNRNFITALDSVKQAIESLKEAILHDHND